MGDIPVIQFVGALLFVILAIGLVAIQFERLARFRWAIFFSCLTCFAGTALVGWLTYEPSPYSPWAIYDEVKSAGNGIRLFGGGRSGDGGAGRGGASRDGQPAGSDGRAGSGGGAANSSAGGSSDNSRSTASEAFSDCAKCPIMVTIPAGEIIVGAPENGETGTGTPFAGTRVRIAKDFAVSRHEIKVDEFMVFASETGFVASGACNTDGVGGASADFREPGLTQTRHHPVVCVNIHDARRYVTWLSARANVPYQLLSEARWEYVRRGLTEPANVEQTPAFPEDGNVKWDGWVASTTPGGRYPANRFGVNDMMGNAAEWTADCWHDDLSNVPVNGSASTSSGDCSAHAVRGGSWDDRPKHARPTSRIKMTGTARDWRVGFRVMRTVSDDVVASQ